MSRSKRIVALALPKIASEDDATYKRMKLCTKGRDIVPKNNPNNYDIKEINTDVFTSDDLPLQGPYQNIILCSDENKNNNVNQASKGNHYNLRPMLPKKSVPFTSPNNVNHLQEANLNSNSSLSIDYVDSEDSYKPFKEDNYFIKSLDPPNDSIIGTYSNNTMKNVCENIDKQDTVCRRRFLYNDLPDSTCSTSNQPMSNKTEEASNIQLIPSCSNVISQDNVLLLDNENIIVHCNTTNKNIEVITNNKQRYIGGKRKCMNNLKQLGEEYEDRKGKIKTMKVFKPLTTTCCKKSCSTILCSEEIQQLIFKEFYKLGNLSAQDQILMDAIQIEDKKRTTTFNRKSLPQTTHDRLITVKYHLQVNDKILVVCKKMFQNIYGIGRGKIDVMIQKKKASITGISPKSGTGTHKSHNFLQEERANILLHIKSFPAYESHYSRKNTSLLYLSLNLNIQKMYDLYKEQCASNGKDCPSNWLYRDVFGETGLKFKLPYVDTCKTCDEFNIKSKYLNGEELELLTERNNIHKNMFDSAYRSKQEDKALLNTTPALKIIVFDLQQCLPTPDLKTNVVFYKRQLWTYNETIRDIGSKESYCYMWHEGLAGRGSNEIGSILYKHIMEKIPNSINHLITYSDTCAGQNRNINVAIMFMLAIQNHPTLQIIDQKFLVPGHTHLECDSDHSRIEKAKKLSDCEISIPIDWYNFVRNVRGKIPLKVVEMEMEHFKNFSALLSGTLIKRNIDENKDKINWLKISWLRYDKSFGIIQFKNSLDTEAPFRKLDIRKITGKTRSGKEPTNVSQVILPQAYNKPNPIDTEKKKDLLSLLPLIRPIYHPFYHGLKTKTKNTPKNNNDSSDDE